MKISNKPSLFSIYYAKKIMYTHNFHSTFSRKAIQFVIKNKIYIWHKSIEKYFSVSRRIQHYIIVDTILLLCLFQVKCYLSQTQKDNCIHNQSMLNLIRNPILFLCVYAGQVKYLGI